jgi:TPR repeat protein
MLDDLEIESSYQSVPAPESNRMGQVDPVSPPTAQEQLELGERYAYGQGVPRDDEEAVKWFRMAADQDNAEAQYKLGVMLDHGWGSLEDPKEALIWYKRAATQGHAGAENNVGNFFRHGRGVPQDKEEAARWYRLAAAHGEDVGRQNLDQLARENEVDPNETRAETAQTASDSQLNGAGPFSGDAAAYLNALYRNDIAAVDAMDRQFARPFQQSMEMMGQTGIYSLYAVLSGGRFSGDGIQKTMSEATANLSLVGPLTVAYIVNYEHIYPGCMDKSPLIYEQTTISQTVFKNFLGFEVYSSLPVTSTQQFRVNRRFKDVFDNLGSADSSGAGFSDWLFGDPKAIKLLDVLADMRQAMRDNKCNSQVMRQLETNMLAKYRNTRKKIVAAERHMLNR